MVRFAMIGTSRIRSPTAPVSIPRPVQAKAPSTTRNASPGSEESGGQKPRKSAPPTKPVAAETDALRRTGSAARGRAQTGSRACRAPPRRLHPALAVDRESHPEQRRQRRRTARRSRPRTSRRPRGAPCGREMRRRGSASRSNDQRGDVDPRPDHANSARKLIAPPMKKTRNQILTTMRASRARAPDVRSGGGGRRRARVGDREQRAHEDGTPTEPPSAARRTARMPQVGASTKRADGSTRANSDSGINIPVDQPDGYSSACENALASRYKTSAEASTRPSRRSRAPPPGSR